MFHILSITGDMVWWAALLIGIAATFVWFLPVISLFHPIAFLAYMVIAVIRSVPAMDAYFWIAVCVLVSYAIRYAAMFALARLDPQRSLMYDEAIRNGIKL